jgi:nitrite reductase/ring-hydroxylating ferredoxin subunit
VSTESRIDAYVEALLRRRRPQRFRATADELEAMAGAHELLLATPARGMPDPAFVDRLHRRLQHEFDGSPPGRLSRRALLAGAGTAVAAAMVAGVAGYRVREGVPAGQPVLAPAGGSWVRVAAASDLPVGMVIAFSAGAMRVLVVNDGGAIHALSGTCTHLGCALAPAPGRIDCPCHRTSFGLDGRVRSHELPVAPAILPSVRVRVIDGQIEVYAL